MIRVDLFSLPLTLSADKISYLPPALRANRSNHVRAPFGNSALGFGSTRLLFGASEEKAGVAGEG